MRSETHSKARRRLLAALSASTLAPGGVDALMVGEPPDSPRTRLDPNRADSVWSGVASLFIAGSTYSAVLVAARYAITAAHVLRDGESITLNLNLDGDLSHQIPVRRAVRHPAFRGLAKPPPIHDLAVLELSIDAPSAARRYPVATAAPAKGTAIELVGYGASGRGSRGVEVGPNAALKRHGYARLVRWPASDASSAWMYEFDFVEPADARVDRPTGLAPGDSGSGAFVRIGDEPALAGINTLTLRHAAASGPPFGYGTRAAGQLLSPQAHWLTEVTAGAVRFR